MALSNGWRYGAPIAAGPLTEWDLWNIVPANPPVSVVTLTGQQFGRCSSRTSRPPLRATRSGKAGSSERCRGIEMLLKLENPAGHRIQQLTVEGDVLGDEQTVDARIPWRTGRSVECWQHRRGVGVDAVQALEDYVRAQQTVSPALSGNIKVV